MKIWIWIRRRAGVLALGLVLALLLQELCLRAGGALMRQIGERTMCCALENRDAIRIVCLGESTTAGQYPSFLGKILSERFPDRKIFVFDRGEGGVNSNFLVSRLEDEIGRYRPDIVVCMIGSNDWGVGWEELRSSRLMWWERSIRVLGLWKMLGMQFFEMAGKYFIRPLQVEQNPPQAEPAGSIEDLIRQITGGRDDENVHYLVTALEEKYIEGHWGPGLEDRFKQVARYFQARIEERPDQRYRWLRLAYLLNRGQRYPEMTEICGRMARRWPDWVMPHLLMADAAFNLGMPEWLGRLMEKAEKIGPENCVEYGELIGRQMEYDRFGPAGKFLLEAIEKYPEEKNTWFYHMASVCMMTGEIEAARSWILRMAPMGKEDPRPRIFKRSLKSLAEGRNEAGYEAPVSPVTLRNYGRILSLLRARGAALVCVQYPMRSLRPLRRLLGSMPGVWFVDNEKSFRRAVREEGYSAYFLDNFAGDFGHCTDKGNALLATNIADVIEEELLAAAEREK